MPDIGDIFNILGQGFDFIAKPFGLAYNVYQDQRDFQTQKSQFGQSMGFANKQLDFLKESRDMAMSREDNAMQRRVADLEASGIHKTLATGMPASAGMASSAGAGAPTGRPGGEQLQDRGSALEGALISKQMRAYDLSNERTLADIERTRAEIRRIDNDIDISRRQLKINQGQLGVNQGQLGVNTKQLGINRGQLDVSRGHYDIARAADQRAAGRYRLELENLKQDVLSKKISQGEATARIRLLKEQALTEHLRQYTEELRQASSLLGIDAQELENAILRHDADITNQSQYRSFDRGTGPDIESFLRTLIPGNSPQEQQAKRILLPLLQSGSYINDYVQSVMRGLRITVPWR